MSDVEKADCRTRILERVARARAEARAYLMTHPNAVTPAVVALHEAIVALELLVDIEGGQ